MSNKPHYPHTKYMTDKQVSLLIPIEEIEQEILFCYGKSREALDAIVKLPAVNEHGVPLRAHSYSAMYLISDYWLTRARSCIPLLHATVGFGQDTREWLKERGIDLGNKAFIV